MQIRSGCLNGLISVLSCTSALVLLGFVRCAHSSNVELSRHESHNALEKFQVRNIQHKLHHNVRVDASITKLEHQGQWMNVSWDGVQDPQDDDYIALYVPASASVYETSPVKYHWAVEARTHRTEGAGSLR